MEKCIGGVHFSRVTNYKCSEMQMMITANNRKSPEKMISFFLLFASDLFYYFKNLKKEILISNLKNK